MIARVWPGDADDRAVVQADWRALPFAPGSFGACIGDGALNMLRWPDEVGAVVSQVRQVVRAEGVIAHRVFCAPDRPEPIVALRAEVMAGGVGFHAFKWRLAQAVMVGDNIAMRAVWQAFEDIFSDRDALAEATGWPREAIAQIDDYRVSDLAKSFPTRAMLKGLLPGARFVESSGYELAERCPVLVIQR